MASGNVISGLRNFKIFRGSMPPDTPRDWRHQRASGLPPRTQISSYGHGQRGMGTSFQVYGEEGKTVTCALGGTEKCV